MTTQLSDEQREDFLDAFGLFDKNSNGTIPAKQLGTVMRAAGFDLSSDTLSNMMDLVEASEEGTINLTQFLTIAGNCVSDSTGSEEEEEELLLAFMMVDTENKGYISTAELKQVMQSLAAPIPSDGNDLIRQEEESEDRNITFKEFVQMMKSK